MRALATLSILASSVLFAHPALAVFVNTYSSGTGNGNVGCTQGGYFTIESYVVTGIPNSCYGTADIPSGVTGIGQYAFSNSYNSSIVIPNSVTSIGQYAFELSRITSIVIPNSVTSIGQAAFQNAYQLTSVTIPGSVTSLGTELFANAVNLESVVFGDGITTIPQNAFNHVNYLTSVTIPNSVTRIEANAFYNTARLTSITIPNSVTFIGDYAFFSNYGGTWGLTSLTVPGSVKVIGEGAFRGLGGLTSVILGNGLTEIGTSAFQGTSALASISIPNSVQSIGGYAFLQSAPNFTYHYCGIALTAQALTTALGSRINTCATTVPNAPTIGTATATGTTTATITFTAPTSDGNSAILYYKATSTPGSDTATAEAGTGSISIAGLTPNTNYSFTVTATNAIGESVPSSASNTITTASLPTTATVVPDTDNPNSRVATFTGSVKEAVIPVSDEMPAIKLAFTGTAPSSVKVTPMLQSQVALSAAPFMVSNSIKIVDILITNGHDGSPVKVCLDGSSTDQLFHYTGGKWVELSSRTYENNQVCGETTSFSPFVAAPAIPAPPYVAPTPVPYLRTLTSPKMNLKDGNAVCTPGTYNSGYTLDGVIQGSAAANFNPINFVYNLLINGVAQTSKSVSSDSISALWDLQSIPSGSHVACSVTVSVNSLVNTSKSTDDMSAVSAAMTTQFQAVEAAESIYAETVIANSKAYQKALIDDRATWRKTIETIQSNYNDALTRIRAKGGPKVTSETCVALKLRIAASKKSAADYAASKPAALAVKDSANKSALDVKSAAIAKANLDYADFIASIAYGILVP